MFSKDMPLEEQKYKEVRAFLEKEIVRLTQLIKEYKEEIKTRGEDFNMDNPNGGMYSGMELTEIHYEMEKRMIYSQEASNDIAFFNVLKDSPYFSKVVFKPENSNKEKEIYIGVRTLQDSESFKMHVCDWRAPIASLFYDDFDEKAYYEAPVGKIYGDLLLKRQFKFSEGKLKYYVDSDVKIDDDILRDVLSSSSGEHLKVIVNSIQREQNKVIRYSDNGNLLVLGPAGSGKTSVGFHRLAYLLYKNREELASSEILMFSNNDIFSSYVADIIPELGEMPINYASFYSIFKAEIPTFQVRDYYSLADEIMNGNKERLKSASVKFSKEFLDFIDLTASNISPNFSDIFYIGKNIISKEELLNRFNDDDETTPKGRGERLCGYVQGVIDKFFLDNKDEIFEIADMETAVDEDTGKYIKRQRRDLKNNAVNMIKNAVILDPVEIYFDILKEYSEKEKNHSLLDTEISLKRGYVEFEDAVGVVYTKTILGTSAVLTGVKHILIDEAQDLSLAQHKIIKRMFPLAKFTLLADTNQAIIPELNTINEKALAQMYEAETLKLNKSYRSTREINTFAMKLLPKNMRYDIFEREGDIVELKKGSLNDLIKIIEKSAENSKTLCVLTKTISEAQALYSPIKKQYERIRLCDNKSCELSNAPVIMPLALSKGLEFDSVIVVDNNGSFLENGNEKYLYLASTRALHKLNIFTI